MNRSIGKRLEDQSSSQVGSDSFSSSGYPYIGKGPNKNMFDDKIATEFDSEVVGRSFTALSDGGHSNMSLSSTFLVSKENGTGEDPNSISNGNSVTIHGQFSGKLSAHMFLIGFCQNILQLSRFILNLCIIQFLVLISQLA